MLNFFAYIIHILILNIFKLIIMLLFKTSNSTNSLVHYYAYAII